MPDGRPQNQTDRDRLDVVAFLGNPTSYGGDVAQVEIIETHASLVFLAGEHAYKLKRAVKYPYLDFSTAALRRRACAAELALNRRTAPQLYLEVRGLRRGRGGAIDWGDEDARDWVVVMRRFDQRALLDSIAKAGALDAPLLHALAAHIADFHAAAELRPAHGGAAAMTAVTGGAVRGLRDCHAGDFAARSIDQFERDATAALRLLAPLLDTRRTGGHVRRGHGDLHLRNICLIDGRPVLFDCLEFSEELASIDVLYDLAFLLMDLEHRGHAEAANRVLNRYLDLTAEEDGLAAVPFFIALRAAIRAQVTATAHDRGWDGGAPKAAVEDARHYLAAACAALCRSPARLVAIGGLSGTGKSTLAARLAPALGVRPGARVLRSDVLRKRHFGVAPETQLPPEAYTAPVTAAVYRTLCERAAAALAVGSSVIVDAVALMPGERRAFAALAAAAGIPFTGLWLEAPAAALASRIAGRRDDASDASTEVLGRQLQYDPGPLDWHRIDAGSGPDAAFAAARRAIELD